MTAATPREGWTEPPAGLDRYCTRCEEHQTLNGVCPVCDDARPATATYAALTGTQGPDTPHSPARWTPPLPETPSDQLPKDDDR